MPRIAHVISTTREIGGAERVVIALLAEGRRRGWEQLVVNPFALDPEDSDLAASCAPDAYAGRACARMPDLPSTLVWLRRALRGFGADIVHAHLVHASVAVATAAPRGTARILTHHHGNSLDVQGRRVEAVIDRMAGHRYDHVVAVSGFVQGYLTGDAGYDRRRVACIPNGWEGEPRLPPGQAGCPTIVCVANLRPGKGHDTLLRAFARVREAVPDAQLVLSGDGVLRQPLVALAEHLAISGAVLFLGHVPDIWPVLQQAHVLALASEYETLGISVLEGMAAGLPVVAAGVGGVIDLVEQGVTGTLVQPGDDRSLAEALIVVLSDPALRATMGDAARRVASQSTMHRTVDSYFNLYADAMATTGGRSPVARGPSPERPE